MLLLILLTYWTDGGKIFKRNKDIEDSQKVSKANIQKIRTELLESYKKRLKDKLLKQFAINLEVKYSKEGTTRKELLYNPRASKIKDELIEVFDEHGGRMLIIGEPGAGKTTLLLQLTKELYKKEEQQIPIIIDIATWRDRFSSVEEWLTELLPQMGFSKALAKQVLKEKLLMPLFDGLDELEAEKRADFLEVIRNYSVDDEVKYVICSRIEEYTQTVDATVYCQIMVKPLTQTQIKESLKTTVKPGAKGILNAMKENPLFRQVITNPFYFNTVQQFFAPSKTWEDIGFTSTTLPDLKAEIVEKFIQNNVRGELGISPQDGKKYLGFLTDRMSERSLVRFELLHLDYDWIKLTKRQLLASDIILSLVFGLVFNLRFGLAVCLGGGLVVGLTLNLFYGLIVCLGGGLVFGLVSNLFFGLIVGLTGGLGVNRGNMIITKDQIRWSFHDWGKKIAPYIAESLKPSLTFGLFVAVPSIIQGNVLIESIVVSLVFGIVLGIVIGLFISLTESLIEKLYFGHQSFLKITKPYQRFHASMRALHFSILQHFHLRGILRRKDYIPKKLVDFLEKHDTILESDGGSWRFRHRILQDYFAKHWEDNYGHLE